ncbi:LOW QUALITY PROTEIN: symplekin-like [Ptychodera flava]|uniref:LOW QUALITY PROTEIN: symplekin-like n=1 Tax=Ptychodera flava TaxID=63121 RepID=UPI003969C8A9
MAADSRRSIASQFFLEEGEDSVQQNTKMETMADKVVDLLNQAHLLTKDAQKINNLKQVQELIVNRDPALLDSFLDEMLQFQHDKSADVKKFVVGFIEEACKKDNELLSNVVVHLNMMLSDVTQNVAVVKKVILCNTQLYKVALKWICKSKTIREEMESTWDVMTEMKNKIKAMLESENDGIRTHVIKFLEMLIIVLSGRTSDSDVPKKSEGDVSLDQMPQNHPILRYDDLKMEGQLTFENLMKFMASPSITSVNLMATMGTMTTVGKQRPSFIGKVVQAFETLHVNLPPTLAKSQVSSVRKNLKVQLLSLLRHPASVEYRAQITTLLSDLGATQQEISKNLAKPSESNKRSRTEEDVGPSTSKKAKVIDDTAEPSTSPQVSKPVSTTSNIDLMAEEIQPLLHIENVANIVLLSMVALPDTMPVHFQATYTPVESAGTGQQINHLSRMMATQFVAAGFQPSARQPDSDDASNSAKDSETAQGIQTVVGGHTVKKDEGGKKKSAQAMIPMVTTQKGVRRIKMFKLAEVTKPMTEVQNKTMIISAMRRILQAEKHAIQGGVSDIRTKVIVCLVTQFHDELANLLKDFIFEDLRNRSELAFSWLYQEYTKYQGYMPRTKEPTIEPYDKCLTELLSGVKERDNREGLFSNLVLQAPLLTPKALEIVKEYCEDEAHVYIGMSTLRDLVLKRPADQYNYLLVLLDLTFHEKSEVRTQAVQFAKRLYERPNLRETIEVFALDCLKNLLHEKPTQKVMNKCPVLMSDNPENTWLEEIIKMCLTLYLALLPMNHRLIHELASVYVATSALIKRTVLRVLENPVRGMGMGSPELLLLVENCPKGAETLITRMLHILTDKAPPSPELVKRVRDLYHKRVSDVRFLIPLLIGLEKKEVIAALPKLIKLNPIVVKEVFHRLLMSHQGDNSAGQSPLSPAELLIALHNIDSSKCDMKSIIKATSLCFNEKTIYTQEVLAVVMQQLMEQNPIPTLLMRTVIQSLSMYPRLIGFVMNILQRLIIKQVWKQKKIWEGFVKCCQRTKPQTFQVLLQLPPQQLKNVFEMSPDLREPLLEHVKSFTPHQRAHIPKSVMQVLETEEKQESKPAESTESKTSEEAKTKQAQQLVQEKLYQQKLAEERVKQQKLLQERLAKERKLKEEEEEKQKKAESKPEASSDVPTVAENEDKVKEESAEAMETSETEQKTDTEEGSQLKEEPMES